MKSSSEKWQDKPGHLDDMEVLIARGRSLHSAAVWQSLMGLFQGLRAVCHRCLPPAEKDGPLQQDDQRRALS